MWSVLLNKHSTVSKE